LAQEPSGEAASDFSPYILLLGILILTVFMLISTRRKIQRSRQQSGLTVKERVSRETQDRNVYSQIGELMAELADLSRQINGQLDTRMAKIDFLLREADQKIEKLQQLTGAKTQMVDKSSVENVSFHDLQRKNGEQPSQPVVEYKENPDPIVREVLNLKERGMSSVAIAQQLDRPVGEIELILSINVKRGLSG
jgi:hypothetical protein